MRTYVPYLLILVAAVLGYLLLGDPGMPAPDDDLGLDGPERPEGSGPLRVEPLEAKGLETRGDPRPRAAPDLPSDPRKLPKGTLLVRPLGPDLLPLSDRTLRLYARPLGQIATKLGLYQEEAAAWKFENVVAGPVEIRVTGDYILGATEEAVVAAGRETTHEVHLEIGGAIQYDVITYEKTRPEQVRVELLDGAGKPVRGWIQERTPMRMTQPRFVDTLTQGPEGVIFGLRPGPYRVKVTSLESEEWDEATVDVAARETRPITLEIRR